MADGYVDRELGQLPVSIGTSLALEGLLGIHPGNPDQPSGYRTIRSVWVNLRTLVRNLYQAIKSENLKRFSFETAAHVVLDEIRLIPEVCRQHGSTAEFTFYYQELKELRHKFPNATFKVPKTEKQNHYDNYEKVVTAAVVSFLLQNKFPLVVIRASAPAHAKVTALLTHTPSDLFWKSSFDRLFLLESYTGTLKTYNAWFTKLNGVDKKTPMPFNPFTLQVFGDNAVFDSQPKKVRDELKQLAETKHWTGITNEPKMVSDIQTYGSRELKNTYATLMK